LFLEDERVCCNGPWGCLGWPTPVTDQYPLSATLGPLQRPAVPGLVECHTATGHPKPENGVVVRPNHTLSSQWWRDFGDQAGACTGSRSKLGITVFGLKRSKPSRIPAVANSWSSDDGSSVRVRHHHHPRIPPALSIQSR
jgi:hypothetical protein